MKSLKVFLISQLLMLSIVLLPGIASADEGTVLQKGGTDGNTITEVTLEGEKKPVKPDEKKEPIYKPDPAKPVKILPNTGEVITTFMYMVIGLSILLLFLGMYINTITRNFIRWEY